MLNLAIFESNAFWWAIVEGLGVTLALTGLSMALGFMLGSLLAVMQIYGTWAARLIAKTYIFVFRGVPLLILLFLAYYGLPRIAWLRGSYFWDIVLVSPFRTAVFVLTINNAAYLGETIRGGLRMVPAGLMEAAAAIGMTKTRAFFRVHAPLALRSILGNLGNETIFVVKASAITSVITVRDLLGGPTVLGKVFLDPLTPLLVVGVIYVVLVQLIDIGTRILRVRLRMPGSVQPHHV